MKQSIKNSCSNNRITEDFIPLGETAVGGKDHGAFLAVARDKLEEEMSDLGDGRPVKDAIYFGLVQGFEEEWGYFSQAEIERLKPRTWDIKKEDLAYAGRRR